MTLTVAQTAKWETDGPEGSQYRHNVRVDALNLSLANGHQLVEILSADGIVLDALRSDIDDERGLGGR